VNLFVADPEWGWWIILYFFLGGVAAGAYFVSSLVEFIGSATDRPLARIGRLLAFPFVAICGLLLTVDLERPERFWHMLLQSEVVDKALAEGWPFSGYSWVLMLQSPILKEWSPMSVGAWALFIFGIFSFLSFVGSVWPEFWLDRWLHRGFAGACFQLAGSAVGFFVASYTGALLTASNQPIWSQTDWIAPLFLASAGSTGISAMLLMGRRGGVPDESLHRLERADLLIVALELAVFFIFLASLGDALPVVCRTWPGILLVFGVPLLGLALPLALHLGFDRPATWRMPAAAGCALLGGFVLRYAIVMVAPSLLALGPEALPATGQGPLAHTVAGWVLLAVTLLLAVGMPLLLWKLLKPGRGPVTATWAASAVICAVVLYFAFHVPPPPQAGTPLGWFAISPEDGRPRGGGVGASAVNRAGTIVPRSKVFGAPAP
jgi:protein NrfD